VKFRFTARLAGDLRRLSRDELELFRKVIRDRFHPAAVARAADPASAWPKSLRIKRVQGVEGIWEMTWSLSGPDGRATFEWIEIDGEPAIFWRRVGGHEILGEPSGD